jgi:hypothetical protein
MVGSEDYELLKPYEKWISERVGKYGGLCCSLSDCRIVKTKQEKGEIQAYIANVDSKGFPKFSEAPNAWLVVPSDVIQREENPTGMNIACWSKYRISDNGFYCFFLPDLT